MKIFKIKCLCSKFYSVNLYLLYCHYKIDSWFSHSWMRYSRTLVSLSTAHSIMVSSLMSWHEWKVEFYPLSEICTLQHTKKYTFICIYNPQTVWIYRCTRTCRWFYPWNINIWFLLRLKLRCWLNNWSEYSNSCHCRNHN